MKDELITRLATETCRILGEMHPYEPCKFLVPSYNALLEAARANHPNEPFFATLANVPLDDDGNINSGPLSVLYVQLRIVLESLNTGDRPSSSTER